MDMKEEILDLLKRQGAPINVNVTDMVDELVELIEDEIEAAEDERAFADEEEDD